MASYSVLGRCSAAGGLVNSAPPRAGRVTRGGELRVCGDDGLDGGLYGGGVGQVDVVEECGERPGVEQGVGVASRCDGVPVCGEFDGGLSCLYLRCGGLLRQLLRSGLFVVGDQAEGLADVLRELLYGLVGGLLLGRDPALFGLGAGAVGSVSRRVMVAAASSPCARACGAGTVGFCAVPVGACPVDGMAGSPCGAATGVLLVEVSRRVRWAPAPGGRVRTCERGPLLAGPLGVVLSVACASPVRPTFSGPRRQRRRLAELSEPPEYAQYEDDPPPCCPAHFPLVVLCYLISSPGTPPPGFRRSLVPGP